jgi:phenylpropionate dioxygenase-like ring-hydroxylating dioxygenase large terminal subunit
MENVMDPTHVPFAHHGIQVRYVIMTGLGLAHEERVRLASYANEKRWLHYGVR